jgi:uncharacterized protein YegL
MSLNNYLIQEPRSLPVIVAVDRSGSMGENGKIDALNFALNEFIKAIKEEHSSQVTVNLALYSFGGNTATCDLPLSSIAGIRQFDNYKAHGKTPLGGAFTLIKELIEDESQIPCRSYRPTIVLITDGLPTDSYQEPMSQLINTGRSVKAFRMALAIGYDADKNMLAKFVSEPHFLLKGENARDIRKFFRFVTMSVTDRMRSQNPDKPPMTSIPDDSILDY